MQIKSFFPLFKECSGTMETSASKIVICFFWIKKNLKNLIKIFAYLTLDKCIYIFLNI